MLTDEPTPVTNKEDTYALSVTVNRQNQEDTHVRNDIVALLFFLFWNELLLRIMKVLL